MSDLERAVRDVGEALRAALVGQEEAIDALLAAILAGGHVLIEGVPGLGKTTLARTAAEALSLTFNRVQFTPDLLPGDLTGTEVIQQDAGTGDRREKFIPGPVFAQILLADEINRAPPKTQSALLEAMEERQVTVGGRTYPLPEPFVVLATENPIEQEGTYPLPPAQQDRFLMKIVMDYPDAVSERHVASRVAPACTPRRVVSMEALQGARERALALPVPPGVLAFAARVARGTRPGATGAPEAARRHVACGASPRAARDLVRAAQARAALAGRPFVSTQDVARAARDVLRHRVFLRPSAAAEGVSADDVVEAALVAAVPPAPGRHPLLGRFFAVAAEGP